MNFTLHRYIDQPQAQLDFPPDSAYPSAQAQHIRYLEGWENHRPKGEILSLWKLGTAPYFATFSLGKIMNLVTLLLFPKKLKRDMAWRTRFAPPGGPNEGTPSLHFAEEPGFLVAHSWHSYGNWMKMAHL